MINPLKALLVEDSEDDAQLVLRALRKGGFDVTSQRVETPDAMQASLAKIPWDVVLSDFSMPHFSGPAALEVLKKSGLDIPFVIVSGKVGEEKAVEMMRSGASDYILKDNLSRLAPALERELREAQGRKERKQLEDLYRQAQKMEALGQLAGGVAHDFNNLITIINGFSDLLLAKLPPNDPSRAFIENIKKAGDRSASLARHLLIFSRKQVVVLRMVDVNSTITEAEKMLNRTLGETYKVIPDLDTSPCHVLADPGQIEQVIFNLALNARDAMTKGGEIAVRTRKVTLAEGAPRPLPDMHAGGYVLLEVADTGVGMTPDVLSHIFEPFFTTKEEGKGTGLGLATVFGIVKQSAGHVTVVSEPGVGTTFRIYLPEAAEQTSTATYPTPKESKSLTGGNEVILLAEDDDGVRTLIGQILLRAGYRVLESRNGQDALDVAQKHTEPIHILVTDVVMPVMGGFSLAERLKKIHPETRVLFVSGYPNDPALRKDSLKGEVAFLLKPLVPSELTTKIRAILDTPERPPVAPRAP